MEAIEQVSARAEEQVWLELVCLQLSTSVPYRSHEIMHSSFILAHEYGHRWGVMGNGKGARVVGKELELWIASSFSIVAHA